MQAREDAGTGIAKRLRFSSSWDPMKCSVELGFPGLKWHMKRCKNDMATCVDDLDHIEFALTSPACKSKFRAVKATAGISVSFYGLFKTPACSVVRTFPLVG